MVENARNCEMRTAEYGKDRVRSTHFFYGLSAYLISKDETTKTLY